MIEIKKNTRVFLERKTSAITIRVRWNNSKNEACFCIGSKWDSKKWDLIIQRPKINTSCYGVTYKVICNKIAKMLDLIENSFVDFQEEEYIPSNSELKSKVLAGMDSIECSDSPVDINALFTSFLNEMSEDRNWKPDSHKKYLALWNNIQKACPEVTKTGFTKEILNKLRDWFIDNNYSNATVTRIFRSVRALMVYFRSKGLEIDDSVINYNVKLKNINKTVVFLEYKELMDFFKFKFSSERLAKVHKAFCFMCFTSLRFSDMQKLTWDNVFEDHIEMITEKTSTLVSIPLISEAKEILKQLKPEVEEPSGRVFHRISNDKFNEYIREAAKEAKLDRDIIKHRIVGTKTTSKKVKLYDEISAHDARRTFVSVADSLGISPSTIMACTGHSSFSQMRGYLGISEDTKKEEMSKFDLKGCDSITSDIDQVADMLDGLSLEQIEMIKSMVKVMKKK